MKFIVSGKEYSLINATKKDISFLVNIRKKLIWPFVKKYFLPDEKMLRNRFSNKLNDKIILKSKKRIGTISIENKNEIAYLSALLIEEKYQGKGLGKYLIEYVQKVSKKKDCKLIELDVWENNPAVNFYKKLGFKKISKKSHKIKFQKEL